MTAAQLLAARFDAVSARFGALSAERRALVRQLDQVDEALERQGAELDALRELALTTRAAPAPRPEPAPPPPKPAAAPAPAEAVMDAAPAAPAFCKLPVCTCGWCAPGDAQELSCCEECG